MKKVIKFFASMKLAVFIIAALAVLISIGTFVESKYDAWTAKNWIYNSVWMYLTLGLLVISLIAVIMDRWPWKPRHLSFICAHVGIIIILYGALLTQLYGIDGTVRLPRSGEVVKEVTVQDTQIIVYRSRTGESYDKVYSEDVNFFKNPLKSHPLLIKATGLNFEILESINYGIARSRVEASSDAQSGAALRFQLSNQNVSEVDWLIQKNIFDRAEKQVGPVFITFGGLWERTAGVNEIRFFHDGKNGLNYALYSKDKKVPTKEGVLSEGDNIQTGWMGLKLQLLRHLPKAQEQYDVQMSEYPTAQTRPSLKVRYNNIETFLVLNDYIKVFTEDWVYIIAYANKRIPLGFDISLAEFKKSSYPGTTRAMAYESEVHFSENQKAHISMNEPLKHAGFYMYQASFEESPTGQALASILSVNKDPGRPWKYIGSLLMSVGVILLFYFKRRRSNLSA